MTNPTLSIIILSFNTSKVILDCLKSILLDKGLHFSDSGDTSTKVSTEIIIVDNGSSDSSVVDINHFFQQKKIPKNTYKIIENNKNLGFSVANNQGIKVARGNYVLLLNSDTIILHSAISQTLTWLSSNPKASMCTAQLLNPNRSIQASGGFFPNLSNILTWSLGLDDLPLFNNFVKPFHPHTPDFYTHSNFYLKDHQQDWLTGAYILTRRPILGSVNGFDENYFMYGEEYELCYRIQKKYPHFQHWYLIGPQIIHLGRASAISQADPLVNEYLGVLHFMQKHHPLQLKLSRRLLYLNAYLRFLLYKLAGNSKLSGFYQEACSKISKF
jgi:GT2 family glycosyltransferase